MRRIERYTGTELILSWMDILGVTFAEAFNMLFVLTESLELIETRWPPKEAVFVWAKEEVGDE